METYSLAENFNKYFEIVFANTQELKEESYKIRHQVYAEELGWEPTSETGLEIDECDDYSLHLLLRHKRTQQYAGTVRLVIPPTEKIEAKMPFEMHCLDSFRHDLLNLESLTRGQFGEISRLSVPASFRRRAQESNVPYVVGEQTSDPFSEEERRNFPNIAVGLYFGILAVVQILNHSHILVVVEPRLQKRLERIGLKFERCGDNFEFKGTRALFYLERDVFTSQLAPEMKKLFDILEQQLIDQIPQPQ